MVDYMIWPFIERIPARKLLSGNLPEYPHEGLHNFHQWVTAMLEDETVKKVVICPEQHVEYMKSSQNGTPDYDLIYSPKA